MELEYIIQWLSDGRATLSNDGNTVTFINTLTADEKAQLRNMVVLAQDRHDVENSKLAVPDTNLSAMSTRLGVAKDLLV